MKKLLAPLAAAVMVLVVATGCTTNRKPRFDSSTGEPEQFRRYTNRPGVDYIFRFNKQAFAKADSDYDGVRSPDKLDVLNRHGRPDYTRDDIRAKANETFDEWVYWDRNVLCQFIQGELVYEGPLMDSDRTLVTYGYPTRAYYQAYETGPVREIWIYEGLMTAGDRTVSFSDGKKIHESTQ